jgi:hypothetical protein
LNPNFHFNRLAEQPLVTVLHRQTHLFGGGAFAGDKKRFDQFQRFFLGWIDPHHEQSFAFATTNGEHPMAGDFGDRFAPIEVVLEFRGGLLFLECNFRFHHSFAPEQLAQFGARLGIVADALGENVARARQSGCHICHAFFRVDISQGLLVWVRRGLLVEEQVSQRFQPKLLGDGGAGAAFRPVRLENILQRRDRLGPGDGGLEFVREEIALGERFQDCLPALIQFRQAQEPFANAGDGHFVQRPGRFLAITGDERNSGAFREEFGGGGDLPRLNFEFTCNFKNVCFVHFNNSRRCIAARKECKIKCPQSDRI